MSDNKSKYDDGRDEYERHFSYSETDGDAPLLVVLLQQAGLWRGEVGQIPTEVKQWADTVRLEWGVGDKCKWEEYVFAHPLTAQVAAYMVRAEIITDQFRRSVELTRNKDKVKGEVDIIACDQTKMNTLQHSDRQKSRTRSSRKVKAHKKSYRRPSSKAGK